MEKLSINFISGHSRRCVRSLLLDPLHLHHPQGALPARGEGRGPPRGDDQRPRPGGRAKIRDLLPVGRIHPLLPGHPLLHPQMALEKLGSREDHCPDDGPRCRSGQRGQFTELFLLLT